MCSEQNRKEGVTYNTRCTHCGVPHLALKYSNAIGEDKLSGKEDGGDGWRAPLRDTNSNMMRPDGQKELGFAPIKLSLVSNNESLSHTVAEMLTITYMAHI